MSCARCIQPAANSGPILSEPLKLMINWAITFLVIALIAAVLGFGGIAGTAVGIAKILFFVFLVLCVIAFVMGRKTPSV